MPLTRYQIRNEYGLADPELYRAADKDDPEALLEGVAMAGLVGVLRQLGDLAEFAAEVFHDLHEEVMATAARGHGLMARVQQLEAEVPSIEKTFLTQTDQTPFFTNAGVDWHPNLCMEQNMITRGDLPRFVMDSCEECRGPPQLFLLDKFDVAGAGACLKRYTDPSFFKVESVTFGAPTAEVQREKKNRKVKKKGARWRNGETPEVMPTSHAKLHQLFLEERVENSHSDPARLVKLKRRQLNGFPFDPKPGKSYMEKFLGTPSPENKEVHEVSVNPPLLRLTLDYSSESGPETIDIGTVSPPKKSLQGRESKCSSPTTQEVVIKPVTPELSEEAINRGIVKVPDPVSGGEADESPCITHKMASEDEVDEVAVDEERKSEGSLDGDHSDDLMSEVDNYMDALTTMESEMETDNEYKPKSDIGSLVVGKHGTGSSSNEEHMDVQANLSDSQSFGNSSMSDDGKSSFNKGISSFSYPDSLSNLAENTTSDNGVAGKLFSSENFAAETMDSLMDLPSVHMEDQGNDSSVLICVKEDTASNAGKASCSCVSDSNILLTPSVSTTNLIVISSSETKLDEMPSDYTELCSKTSNTDQNGTALPDSSVFISDVPSQTVSNNSLAVSSEDCLVKEVDHEDSNVLVHMENISDLEKEGDDGSVNDMLVPTANISDLEKEGDDVSVNGVLQTDYADGLCDRNLVEGKITIPHSVISSGLVHEECQKEYVGEICDKDLVEGESGSPLPIVSPSKEQLLCSVLPKADVDSGVTLASDSSDVLKPVQIISEVDDITAATGVNSENLLDLVLTPVLDSIKEDQCSDIAVNSSAIENDLRGEVLYSKDNIMRVEEISWASDGEETGGCTGKVDVVGEGSVSLEHPVSCADKSGLDHVNLDGDMDSSLVTVDVTTGSEDHFNDASCLPSDLVCSKSTYFINIQESPSRNEDVHQNGLEATKGVSSECCIEPEEQKEVKQLEVAYTELKSSVCGPVSGGHGSLEVPEHIHKSALTYQAENSSYFSEAAACPLSNQGMESKHAYLNHSEDACEDTACSPTSYLQRVQTSLEQPVEQQADHFFAESPSAVMHKAISESLNLQHSPPCSFADSGIPSDQSVDLQSGQLDLGCLQVDEATSRSLDLQSEQIRTVGDIGQERCLDATSQQEVPSQEFLVQSEGPKLSSTTLSKNPFDCGFPSFGLLPKNLEEMPPLPPLPPMQWRMGKFQPSSLASQGEWAGHGQDTCLPMQPEKSQSDSRSLGIDFAGAPSPLLPVTSADIQKLKHLSTESEDNYMQPVPLSLGMPTSVRDSNNQQDFLPLDAKQSLNPLLNLPETANEKPEDSVHASGGNPLKSSPDPLSQVATVEDQPTEHDTVPSHGQVTPESTSEAKLSEHFLQSSEVERNFSGKFVLPPTPMIDQPQHDLVTMHEETRSPSTLALPPNYEVGKPNGSKLPRPRNPLIDAVAAHDKSKLRKVTERVQRLAGPKPDERDSLLEQIRAKSFNLKPATATRPSIQGIQGPKTNLKVAAILEKANAIRQALAGSDEDDDTDSWSDS